MHYFIVIDALDEKDVLGTRYPCVHNFFATRLGELPSNFRILITPRPEPDLERALFKSPLVHRFVNDLRLTTELIYRSNFAMQSLWPLSKRTFKIFRFIEL